MDIKTKREKEKEIVSLMIAIYCRKKHRCRREEVIRRFVDEKDVIYDSWLY